MADMTMADSRSTLMRSDEDTQFRAWQAIVRLTGGDVGAAREVAAALGLLPGLVARRAHATRDATEARTGTDGP